MRDANARLGEGIFLYMRHTMTTDMVRLFEHEGPRLLLALLLFSSILLLVFSSRLIYSTSTIHISNGQQPIRQGLIRGVGIGGG